MNKLRNTPDRPDRLYGKRLNGVFAVSGIVHVIRDESELPFVREGEILVAEAMDPAWVQQLSLAKGIIQVSSGSANALDVITGQYDIPAISDVSDAMASLRSGDIVTMHGDGDIELLSENRAPDSPMRVSVPDAVEARRHNGIITATNVVAFSSALPDKDESDSNDSPDTRDTDSVRVKR